MATDSASNIFRREKSEPNICRILSAAGKHRSPACMPFNRMARCKIQAYVCHIRRHGARARTGGTRAGTFRCAAGRGSGEQRACWRAPAAEITCVAIFRTRLGITLDETNHFTRRKCMLSCSFQRAVGLEVTTRAGTSTRWNKDAATIAASFYSACGVACRDDETIIRCLTLPTAKPK